ncbi:carboxymethylenebutenolidase [Agrococcus baldri]|uniref:Carboxymethylenebutenolidase n=1 Tax=Agrococcus baldri TaxID=153730 RepID=A0AA94HM20_9MICO|nr:alpha/beta fold hydrolase [Agrococcus baldri]SFS09335.1 carboxymethylenebutenolidase [Agrococcus baldri]
MAISTGDDTATRWHGTEGDPVVVVLHDWNGRLPWAESFGARLAAEGFRVAVPDLYDGRSSTADADARVLLKERTADMDGAHRIVSETIGEARALGSPAAALVGFSMGSMIALEYAAQGSVDAVVAYYGSARDVRVPLRVPVLFQLAERDSWRGRESPTAMRERLAGEGFDGVEIRHYAGAVHGFQNEQVAQKFSADASAAAWEATLAFLRAHLLGPVAS